MSRPKTKGARTVWIVKGEGNTDHESWIVGAYATKKLAERHVERLKKEERKKGGIPYGDPDPDDEDGGESMDWTVDWEIEEHEIEGGKATVYEAECKHPVEKRSYIKAGNFRCLDCGFQYFEPVAKR